MSNFSINFSDDDHHEVHWSRGRPPVTPVLPQELVDEFNAAAWAQTVFTEPRREGTDDD